MTNITYQFNLGVDVAKQKFDVSFNDHKVASFENNLAGFKQGQVSWLSGRRLGSAFPDLCPVAWGEPRLADYSCGAAPACRQRG
jgi:hypothetical protein